MIDEIEERNRQAFEFLKLLYQKTVGANDRMKDISIGEIAHELNIYNLPDPETELTDEEKDGLYESGQATQEIVIRLQERDFVELLGHPHPYYGGSVSITRTGIDEVESTIRDIEFTDNELRGIILQKYYDLRKSGQISINQKNFGALIELEEIFRISRQLSENGLIDFKPLYGDDRIYSALGEITAKGIDIVENEGINSPIQITFINNQVNYYHRDQKLEEEMLQILRLLKDRSDTEESLAEKANAIIQLQPNFAGIGLNINEIIKRLISEK